MAYRVPVLPTAFSTDPGRRTKQPRRTAAAHLDFIRKLPCLISGSRRGVEAAHIRYRDPVYGKRGTGMGEKPDDAFTVPLSAKWHRLDENAQHNKNEREFWIGHDIDPLEIATKLYAVSGNVEAGELIIKTARSAARKAKK